MPLIACPGCTNPVSDQAAHCPKCGQALRSTASPSATPPLPPARSAVPTPVASMTDPGAMLNKNVSGLLLGGGILAAVLFAMSGLGLLYHGWQMAQIQTESGRTIMENYYQQAGYCEMSIGAACFAMAVLAMGVSAGLSRLLVRGAA